jgi:hypothetical protein
MAGNRPQLAIDRGQRQEILHCMPLIAANVRKFSAACHWSRSMSRNPPLPDIGRAQCQEIVRSLALIATNGKQSSVA